MLKIHYEDFILENMHHYYFPYFYAAYLAYF